MNPKQHSYEEIRAVIIDILLKRESTRFEANQFAHLTVGISEVFERREQGTVSQTTPYLNQTDAELARDVFWDLFRQGFITLGYNDANQQWPFFRLSYFGQAALLTQNPYRFHDRGSFITMVKAEVPDLSVEAEAYLAEAVVAFYSGCLLASCVMLGVAAEAEFLRMADIAAAHTTHGPKFAAVQKAVFIRDKIRKFELALTPLLSSLPRSATEDFETNFAAIQSVLRIARNDAGHPTSAAPQRESVYVLLQLFVPFGRQLMRLRKALA